MDKRFVDVPAETIYGFVEDAGLPQNQWVQTIIILWITNILKYGFVKS